NLVKDNGDIRFEGAITGYDVRPVALQGNDAAALNRLTLSVNVRYINSFDDKKNFEQNFSRFVDFPSTTDIASNEESLIGEINKQLVQDIYDRSFGNW
ncbi:MAG: LPS assembly lipoprotein LptE, partial [Flavobacteriales bacterium]